MAHSHVREASGSCRQEGRCLAVLYMGFSARLLSVPWAWFSQTGEYMHCPLRPTLGSHAHHLHHILVVEEAASICLDSRGEDIDPTSP